MSVNLDWIEQSLSKGPRGGEPEVGVPQYQAYLGVEDAYAMLAELRALRAEVKRLKTPLCIGAPTIRILATEGAKQFDSGHALVAADDLFHKDPYAEVALLRELLKEVKYGFDTNVWDDELEDRIAEALDAAKGGE